MTLRAERDWLVEATDAHIERILPRQIDDGADHGGFVDPATRHCDPRETGYIIPLLTAALTEPGSRWFADARLGGTIIAALDYLIGRQYPDGSIDLICGRGSGFEAAFVVSPMTEALRALSAPGVLCAPRSEHASLSPEVPDAVEVIRAAMERFLAAAGNAVRTMPMATANHRWVAVAALASLDSIDPDPANARIIESYLADGLDLTPDGSWSERSPNYAAVSNRVILQAYRYLRRPELLDAVRRSLEFTRFMVHPGEEAVNEISFRQDRGRRSQPFGSLSTFREAAVLTGDPSIEGGARALFARLQRDGYRPDGLLPELLLYRRPEFDALLDANRESTPLPASYRRLFAGTGCARLREGRASVTVLGESEPKLRGDTLVAFRMGERILRGVRVNYYFWRGLSFGTPLHGDARFDIDLAISDDRTVTLTSRYRGLTPSVVDRSVRPPRDIRRIELPADLTLVLTVRLEHETLTLEVDVAGDPRIVLEVELDFDESVEIEGASVDERGRLWMEHDSLVLRSPSGPLRLRADNHSGHRYPIPVADPVATALRVTGYSPYRGRIVIEPVEPKA